MYIVCLILLVLLPELLVQKLPIVSTEWGQILLEMIQPSLRVGIELD